MPTEWTFSDILLAFSTLLMLVVGPIFLLQYYRQHREDPGIRGNIVFNVAMLFVATVGAWPVRSALTDVVTLVSLLVMLVGIGVSWRDRRRSRTAPPAVAT